MSTQPQTAMLKFYHFRSLSIGYSMFSGILLAIRNCVHHGFRLLSGIGGVIVMNLQIFQDITPS